jgi:hypothetical protein
MMIVISRCVAVLRNEVAQKRQRIFSSASGNIFVSRGFGDEQKWRPADCVIIASCAQPLFIRLQR